MQATKFDRINAPTPCQTDATTPWESTGGSDSGLSLQELNAFLEWCETCTIADDTDGVWASNIDRQNRFAESGDRNI
jgi:hypothetical protein